MRRIFITLIIGIASLIPAFAQTTSLWGWVTVCCAHLRSEPRHGAEMVSQAILGTPLKILEKGDKWYRVETPEGYLGWMIGNSIVKGNDKKAKTWRETPRSIYTGYQGFIYAEPSTSSDIISDVVTGSIVETQGEKVDDFVAVVLPDGRKGYIQQKECCDLAEWAARPFNMKRVISIAKQMTGSTYLWGGTSVKGADCSGMTKTAYFAAGVILLRDASQQATTGEAIATGSWRNYQTGDLLFFGNAKGRVNHVAIYLQEGKYIHSSGRVKINSLDPHSPDYLKNPVIGVRRIKNSINSKGITAVQQHPWYFNQK